MSVKDLAIDVGLVQDSEEYSLFISCVNNILDLGCGYSEETTKDIIEKCHTSELDIAKKVLRECRRSKTSSIRKSNLKWWQAYVHKRGFVEDREPSPVWSPERRRNPPSKRRRKASTERRPMDLTFHKNELRSKEPRRRRPPEEPRRRRPPEPRRRRPPEEPRRRRPPEPRQHRPMSPMFEKTHNSYRRPKRRRSMSPMFEEQQQGRNDDVNYERSDYESSHRGQYSDVPRWPTDNNKKRRRYR